MASKSPAKGHVSCPPHAWKTTKLLGDVCSACGTTFIDHVRGFSVKTSNFEMPSKSFRHKRVLEALGGGEQE